MSSTNELHEKIKEYASFISQTLQPQLQAAVDARDATDADMSEYTQLRNKLQYLENEIGLDHSSSSMEGVGGQPSAKNCKPLEALVDICHETVYCRAVIPNPRTVYVDVGLGFMVEFTLQEAIGFIEKKLKYLDEVLKHRASVAEGIARDVENALELLEELGAEIPDRETS
ncbi:hypothetical protein HJC23_006336 [Cyclotella cryptica]|uniref:Prefoldin subunit n=1 Tax=Cyclotella cryptica TaxID=29204 RepID=A0ABD3QA10_9STRA|eukprot:CCRYP_008745-RA/>CCRYP_008745-RA protein AED:0.32 eAED:0.32 QI:0/-1/0/1/-1/1/1/0/170